MVLLCDSHFPDTNTDTFPQRRRYAGKCGGIIPSGPKERDHEVAAEDRFWSHLFPKTTYECPSSTLRAPSAKYSDCILHARMPKCSANSRKYCLESFANQHAVLIVALTQDSAPFIRPNNC